jgi:hypothetical protein
MREDGSCRVTALSRSRKVAVITGTRTGIIIVMAIHDEDNKFASVVSIHGAQIGQSAVGNWEGERAI